MENPKIRFKGYTKDWEQRKLGDMGSTFTGLSGKTKEDFGHGDAQFITYMNVFSNPVANLEMTEAVEIDAKQNRVKKGDVFFTTSSETPEEVGMSCVMPENKDNIYLNSFCFGYRPTEKFDLDYLAYVLRADSFRKEMKFLAQGISRYNISKNKVMEVSIPIPNLEEQTMVGRYFSTLDHLITLHQRKCEQTKKLKKYMLQKMFPQNGAKVPEIRFDGFTYDWEQRKLSELLEKYEDPVETPHDGYERVGIRSHAKGTFHSFVEPGKELDTAKMYRVAADKFILNITFAWEHAVAITDNNDAGKLVSHRFPQFSFNPKLKPHFFKYLMLDKKFREHLELSSPGGAGRNRVLKISDMLKYEIKLPSIEEQIKIGEYFDSLDHLITLHQRQTDFYKKPNFYFISS